MGTEQKVRTRNSKLIQSRERFGNGKRSEVYRGTTGDGDNNRKERTENRRREVL